MTRTQSQKNYKKKKNISNKKNYKRMFETINNKIKKQNEILINYNNE